MRISIFTLIMVFAFQLVSAQERLSGLVVNPKVKKASTNYVSSRDFHENLTLPFFDDFSNTDDIFPSASHWSDNFVFINDDYSVNPPTVGVATLDAIDNFGSLYSTASSFIFEADTLTSVAIRLDSVFTLTPRRIVVGDSLYLSFFYQPQGLGNAPAAGDSLVLEFLAPDETVLEIIPGDTLINNGDTTIIEADTTILESWVRVWRSQGDFLENFHNINGSWFKQVMVPILDEERFFKPNFKFRFRNYASLADAQLPDWQSNGDQWNIDYVYLNVDRSVNDTAHPDVAFASKAPNMLSRYTSMPYDQYRKKFVTEMADSLNLKIANLDNESYNAEYRYVVKYSDGDSLTGYSGGTYFIPPYATSGYVTHPPFANPPVRFQFPINEPEPVSFTVTHILEPTLSLGRRENDTVKKTQVFSNYLSYDDGTSEAGYGVAYEGAQVAYKFQLNKNDSLFGIQMFFNQTLTQGNQQDFYINVWNDFFGKPGEMIYSRFGYEPVFTDSLNKFFYYELDSAIFIEPGRFPNLTFYVGWEQSTDDNLNVGFDRSNNASKHLFYRTFGDWTGSLFEGALMVRPIIGKEKILSLDEKKFKVPFSLYPNPATGDIVRIKTNINTSDFRDYSIRISSSDGRLISSLPLKSDISVNYLVNGMYFIQLTRDNVVVAVEKLIINR